uniref:Leucine rich immune protein (Coil-less) n=1 Tax=Anopheles epiroticus TaxID=199890 RepID=A0A9I3FGW1_9DIPT
MCNVYDMKSKGDFFMNGYIPCHVTEATYQNVLFNKLDHAFFHALPRHVKHVHITRSPTLRSISIPREITFSEFSITATAINRIEIDERNVIKEFTVDESKFITIPNAISHLQEAEKIGVTNSPITVLDMASFCYLSKVQVLNLFGNRIRHIVNSASKNCSVYNSLQYFHISNNLLKNINMEVFNAFSKLELIEFKQNRLRLIQGSFRSMAPLKLYLLKNKLKAIDFCRWNVPHMVFLELDSNELTAIPDCLENISSLTSLYLAGNQIESVSIESFAALSNLNMINLSVNKITTFELHSVRYPRSLRWLYVSNNNITAIDLSLVPVPSLEVFVNGNCISKFDTNNISPNVTILLMIDNPIDCSWQSLYQRNNVTCIEDATSKVRCN